MSVPIPIDRIDPNPWQTRQGEPDQGYIKELALDIASNGLLQVPMGRLVQDGKQFDYEPFGGFLNDEEFAEVIGEGARVQLAFGHNRLNAYRWLKDVAPTSNLPGDWSAMLVTIRDLTDEQMADFAWSENERRRDVDPISRALAIQRRIQDFGWTHDQAAAHMGLSRPVISNTLRLLGLPENVQAAVAQGKLSARQADALLQLYALPEKIRAAAEAGYGNRPSSIVKAALEKNLSSDEIRQGVTLIVHHYGARLSESGWKLDDVIEGEGLISPTCKDCPERFKEHNLCLNKACYDRKAKIRERQGLEGVASALGIPVYDGEMSVHEITGFRTWNGSDRTDFETIKANGCPNLRLIPSRSSYNGNNIPDHKSATIVCQKRSGYCTCLKGLEMQRELAKRQAASAPAQPDGGGRTLVEVFEEEDEDPEPATDGTPQAPSTKDLEELARKARQEKREVGRYKRALIQAMGQRLAVGLLCCDQNTLRLVAGRELSYRFNGDEAETWDLDTLLQQIGEYVAERALPWEPRSANHILDTLNDELKKYGVKTIEMPELPEGKAE